MFKIYRILKKYLTQYNLKPLIFITHNMKLAKKFDIIYEFKGGRIKYFEYK